MNKKYSKPDIVFESFSLATSIAGTCGIKTGVDVQASGQCGFWYGDIRVFLDGVTGCDLKIEDGSLYDGLCYDVPTADKALFNS